MASVRFAPAARHDLHELQDYIARDSVAQARRVVAELRERCRSLTEFPSRGAPRPELGSGVRLLVHGAYLILYSERDDDIVVERVIHAARDLRSLNP